MSDDREPIVQVQIPDRIREAQDSFEGPQSPPGLVWPAGNAIERLFCFTEILFKEVFDLWKAHGDSTRARWLTFLNDLPTSELERFLRIPEALRDVMMTHEPEAAWQNFRATMEEVEAASGKRESQR